MKIITSWRNRGQLLDFALLVLTLWIFHHADTWETRERELAYWTRLISLILCFVVVRDKCHQYSVYWPCSHKLSTSHVWNTRISSRTVICADLFWRIPIVLWFCPNQDDKIYLHYLLSLTMNSLLSNSLYLLDWWPGWIPLQRLLSTSC